MSSNGMMNGGSANGGVADPYVHHSQASSPLIPPPVSKSPLVSPLLPIDISQNSPQPNSPNIAISSPQHHDIEHQIMHSLNSATSADDHQQQLSVSQSGQHLSQVPSGEGAKGRLIENEKIIEYGGPNNRYAKVTL
jgi:hypothetical protein